MDETKEPQQEFEKSIGFRDALDYFPESEQEEAEFYISIYDQVLNSPNRTNLYNKISAFTVSLMKEKNVVQNCKLYHLFSGSGKSRESWQTMLMDTPDKDFKRFVYEELIPLLTKQGF